MPRWKPDAQLRLETAALELFAENGYDGTTVSDIAERAGLMKRSFFRYFPDKREVLFAGSQALSGVLRDSVESSSRDENPWETLLSALVRTGELLTANRHLSRMRRQVIAANPELREREVLKAAQIEDLLTELSEERDVDPRTARHLARLALVVYQEAFDYWLDAESDDPPFCDCVTRAVEDLRDALLKGHAPAPSAGPFA
jgi:AcrR family transcriptional regulator